MLYIFYRGCTLKYNSYHLNIQSKSEQSIMIEQSKISYSPLGKAFEKQTKIIEDQEIKQIRLYKLIILLMKKNYQ